MKTLLHNMTDQLFISTTMTRIIKEVFALLSDRDMDNINKGVFVIFPEHLSRQMIEQINLIGLTFTESDNDKTCGTVSLPE